MSQDFVNLKNAREDDQLKVMQKIKARGVCPFCPNPDCEVELMEIIYQGRFWTVRTNRWPYKNTRLHLIAIYNDHAESLKDIDPRAGSELFRISQWIEDQFNLKGGGIFMRFGDIRINGATVGHIHAHIVSAEISDRDDPRYEAVRFRVG